MNLCGILQVAGRPFARFFLQMEDPADHVELIQPEELKYILVGKEEIGHADVDEQDDTNIATLIVRRAIMPQLEDHPAAGRSVAEPGRSGAKGIRLLFRLYTPNGRCRWPGMESAACRM